MDEAERERENIHEGFTVANLFSPFNSRSLHSFEPPGSVSKGSQFPGKIALLGGSPSPGFAARGTRQPLHPLPLNMNQPASPGLGATGLVRARVCAVWIAELLHA
jgi:hypothetical protein